MARLSQPAAIDQLLEILAARAPRPLSIDELMRLAALGRYDRRAIRRELEQKVAEGRLRRIGKTRYQWRRDVEPASEPKAGRPRREKRAARAAIVGGLYRRVRAGFGFVEITGPAATRYRRDVLIPSGREGGALHEDEVQVEITGRRGPRLTGAVVAITRRAHEQVVGTLSKSRGGWVLLPESAVLPPIPLSRKGLPPDLPAGQAARVRIIYPTGPQQPIRGELLAVLGDPDSADVQFLSIALEHGLAVEFEAETLAEAHELPDDPTAEEIEGREDLRHLPFVTIDGETARDFDDAVCLQPDSGGGCRVWVAIADVSHYVRPGSGLDAEAARRGTSVYFPDRAIPMLPPELSSQLCSLLPRRPRLVWVCELEYGKRGKRKSARLYRGVIESRARLTYTQVSKWIGEERSSGDEGVPREILEELRAMRQLMQLLYRRRIQAGSLDLDLPEALVDLSQEGKSIGVRTLARNDAHRIIEELMLEANQAVAAFLRDHDVAFPYRVHEPPRPADIDELNLFLGAFGLHIDYEHKVEPADIQRVLNRLEGHRLARVLTRQILRSLTQACYTTRNGGHFGLAFSTYCHFTSPIRRYPDLLVHRQLAALSDRSVGSERSDPEWLEAECLRSSQAERRAMEAERAMLDLKKAEFMLGHLNEPEPGMVATVTDFGFFVALDRYPIEGLVRLDDLRDDHYQLVERERALRGARTRRRIRLGDRVVVKCIEASTRRRTIDFEVVEWG